MTADDLIGLSRGKNVYQEDRHTVPGRSNPPAVIERSSNPG